MIGIVNIMIIMGYTPLVTNYVKQNYNERNFSSLVYFQPETRKAENYYE